MPFAPGHELAHYEIIEPIGQGGMGEVYRAKDTALGREVAIKVLPDSMARDSERMARFEREAQLLASLNHPNIATIHGFEKAGDARFLVMELVEGETLSERMVRRALPVEDALAIARQIAVGLEAAHEKGIVHRDLKPANVKVTPEHEVKILDFGLAKGLDEEVVEPADSNSPTLTRAATRTGVLLGTAAYMSPEQARGQAVDRRADLWAFGVVLYEMLTGKRLFGGATVSDTLAEVLKSEVDWGALPAETPASIRKLLRRCLERDRKERLGWAGDARLEIDDASTETDVAAMASGRGWVAPAFVALALGAGGMALVGLGSDSDELRPTRKLVIPAEGRKLLDTQAISPDGEKIAYVAEDELWIRRLDRLEAREVPESDGAELPFWSPESDFMWWARLENRKELPIRGSSRLLCYE